MSSRSADGVDNLAPHSFFTVASAEPPVICFAAIATALTSSANPAPAGEPVTFTAAVEPG